MAAKNTATPTELEYLMAQKKQLDEQIKALKTANKASKLEREIERQAADPGVWFVRLRNRVTARVKAGQPHEQAVDEVLAYYRALLLAPAAEESK